VVAALIATSARAVEPPKAAEPPVDAQTAQAREEFVQGTDFVHKAQWAEALAAFERSAKLKAHAVTTYNIGACERALGRYTRARKTLRASLAQNDQWGGSQLPEGVVTEVKAYLDQIQALLAAVNVTLEPAEAAIAVDGRPLDVEDAKASPPVLVAGIRPPGPGETPPAGKTKIVLDPGAHVFTLSRKGYADAVVNKTLAPGTTTELPLSLDRLPATIHVAADQPGAVVRLQGLDVGVAPVDVSRPAGSYKVEVQKSGFVTYESQLLARPGEEVTLRARLPEDKPSIVSRWWFWTGIGVVVAGAAAGTYFATRPAPERPPLNGGGLGWVVPVQ
jgi:hypothetical protein